MNRYRLLRGAGLAGAALLLVAGAAFASQMALGPTSGPEADPTSAEQASSEPVETPEPTAHPEEASPKESSSPGEESLLDLLTTSSESPESEASAAASAEPSPEDQQGQNSQDEHGDEATASASASPTESWDGEHHDDGGTQGDDHESSGGTHD